MDTHSHGETGSHPGPESGNAAAGNTEPGSADTHARAPGSRVVRRCATCGWPSDEPYEVVSRHPVTEGVIVYSRCACGVLRVWLHRTQGTSRLVVGAHSTLPASPGNPGSPTNPSSPTSRP